MAQTQQNGSEAIESTRLPIRGNAQCHQHEEPRIAKTRAELGGPGGGERKKKKQPR